MDLTGGDSSLKSPMHIPKRLEKSMNYKDKGKVLRSTGPLRPRWIIMRCII